jgi:hypothetical protein
MGSTDAMDSAAAFTEELLRTGVMLSELASNLVEALPADAYPGEEPGAVVIDMVTGTIRTALAAVDERDLEHATELIAASRDHVLEHLKLALAFSRRIQSTEGGPGTSPTDG